MCFYCPEPILPGQQITEGIEVVAHRACVDKKLDRICPDWRDYLFGAAEQHIATRQIPQAR
jgi:hypothetical protein